MKRIMLVKAIAIVLMALVVIVGCTGKGNSGGSSKANNALLKALQGNDANAVQTILAEGSAALSSLFSNASPSGDYAYDLLNFDDGKGIRINKYTGNGGVVIVPQEIEGYTVKVIGDRAFSKSHTSSSRYYEGNDSIITAIILPDTIQYFGSYAFTDRNDMHTINLPSNLKITNFAFNNCSELFNLIIPNNLTIVQRNFLLDFNSCQKLPLKTRERLQELNDQALIRYEEMGGEEFNKFLDKTKGRK